MPDTDAQELPEPAHDPNEQAGSGDGARGRAAQGRAPSLGSAVVFRRVLGSAGRRFRSGPRTVFGTLVVVTVVLTAAATALGAVAVGDSGAESGRTAAVHAARQTATDLMTISKDTATQDLDQLLAASTGDFRAQFAQQAEGFRKVLETADIDSSGRVDEAALVTYAGDTATALVAATATVKNSQSPHGDLRRYRMRIDLVREGDRWLVSTLEFVA